MRRAPEFWERTGPPGAWLRPVGALIAAIGRWRRDRSRPWRAPVPVICVGNLIVGGTGKTPVAAALVAALARQGARPQVLLRGYGGSARGPLLVDPQRHEADEVGDEALLHAGRAPTWIGADRAATGRLAVAAGATHLVLDDGLQSGRLVNDLALVVVDGGYGFGNGYLLPAGPLREPVAEGLARAHALVILGPDRNGVADLAPPGLAVVHADLVLDETAVADLGRSPLFAFAGIGRPEKFFAALRQAGLRLAGTRAFSDHHRYGDDELEGLARDAARLNARLVTTTKDAVRLPRVFRDRCTAVAASVAWRDPAQTERLLAGIAGTAPINPH